MTLIDFLIVWISIHLFLKSSDISLLGTASRWGKNHLLIKDSRRKVSTDYFKRKEGTKNRKEILVQWTENFSVLIMNNLTGFLFRVVTGIFQIWIGSVQSFNDRKFKVIIDFCIFFIDFWIIRCGNYLLVPGLKSFKKMFQKISKIHIWKISVYTKNNLQVALIDLGSNCFFYSNILIKVGIKSPNNLKLNRETWSFKSCSFH